MRSSSTRRHCGYNRITYTSTKILERCWREPPAGCRDAIAEFQAALRLRPDYAYAHNNLGNALAETPGRLPDAIAEYLAALRIEPDHTKAHINLGDALVKTGRLSEAIAEYEAALRIRPDPGLQQLVDRLRSERR